MFLHPNKIILLVALTVWLQSAEAQLEWSAPAPVQTNHANDAREDLQPVIAVGLNGTVIAAWQADITPVPDASSDVFASRSVNRGASWAPPILLGAPFTDGEDTRPTMATDGKGTWVVVYVTDSSLGDTIGDDLDIVFVRSTDDGQTFGSPQPLSDIPAVDGSATDGAPAIATDGKGNWICVWESTHNPGNFGSDDDIWFAMSNDNGATWGSAGAVNSNAESDSVARDVMPTVASDGTGQWIAAWITNADFGDVFDGDFDVAYATMSNGSLAWSAIAHLNNSTAAGAFPDSSPRLAGDGNGNWYCTWSSFREPFDNGVESDIFFVRSSDDGLSWGALKNVQVQDTPNEGHLDRLPIIASDKRGNLVLAWDRDAFTGPPNSGGYVKYTVSNDHGDTWSPIADLNTFDPTEVTDGAPALATDFQGGWFAAWESSPGPNESEKDVDFAKGSLTGDILGRLFDAATLAPITCAGIRVEPVGNPLASRYTSTDLQGRFEVFELPNGSYTLEAYPVGYPPITAAVVVAPGKTTTFTRGLSSSAGAADIAGQVTDADTGEPIAGAQISARIGGFFLDETVTCASGRFEFRNLLPKGGTSVEVTYESEGYDTETQNVDVEPGMTADGDQTMEKSVVPLTTLSGIVRNAQTDAPIANAQVTVEGAVNNTRMTAGDGIYVFEALPDGPYTVRASSTAFESSATLATLAPGIAQVDFALEPGAPTTADQADINGDGLVNAVDVQLAINALLGLDPTIDADVDDDGDTDSVDLQTVINAALGVG